MILARERRNVSDAIGTRFKVVSSAKADRNSKRLTGVYTGIVLTKQACSWKSAKFITGLVIDSGIFRKIIVRGQWGFLLPAV